MTESPPTTTATPTTETPTTPTSPTQYVADPAARFRGIGTNFRAKLIGIDEVIDSRGDKMCQDSILKLKAAVQASGQHKQRIVVNVSLEGIKLIDQLGGQVEHVHPVHRISFISRDLTDRRAFGYVFGVGDGKHQFFGIKTQKVAETLVLALRDLFQVVYDMKKKEMESAKNTTDSDKKQANETPANTTAPAQQQGGLLEQDQGFNKASEPWAGDNGPTSLDMADMSASGSNGDIFGTQWIGHNHKIWLQAPTLQSKILQNLNNGRRRNKTNSTSPVSTSSSSGCWPQSTQSSEERDSSYNISSGVDKALFHSKFNL